MTQDQIIASIRRNWPYRHCDEARQCIRWRIWELRELRRVGADRFVDHQAVEAPVSYATQVIADNSGKWAGNALRFATELEALDYVADLAWRWTLVRQTRVIQSQDPVNAEMHEGQLRHLT